MSSKSFAQPFQLLPIFRARVWGRETLAPYFPENPCKERIGEVWFTFEENLTEFGLSLSQLITLHPEVLGIAMDSAHPGLCPILVKLLFTSERLSVQVHPDDDYAQKHHAALGKTEAWCVLAAEPQAEVAVGFKTPLSAERLKQTAQSGEIEQLLDWRPVAAGDVIFVPAGTVHAIGAGLSVCEIQENSDITYRLYDYGRGRELHLERGVAVSDLRPYTNHALQRALSPGRVELVACRYFRIERLSIKERLTMAGGLPFYLLWICVKGAGTIAGRAFKAGQAWMIPADAAGFSIQGAGSEWILTYQSARPLTGIIS